MFVYYCCKLLDFCDTLFMVLGKKTRQYTLLHVWHHASIVPLFGYYLSTGMGGGFISALPVWNSLVHVIMYSHYLITSLFTFKRMWWKPIITASQMGHHVLIMMYMILNRVYVRPTATATAILPHTLQLSLRLWSVGSTETATLTPRVRAHERLCPAGKPGVHVGGLHLRCAVGMLDPWAVCAFLPAVIPRETERKGG